jgi:endoglucanase
LAIEGSAGKGKAEGATHSRDRASRLEISSDWTQGLQNGANGPIPAIVVDQFGYPTSAKKIAVIRDPQVGYDNPAHFVPGNTYSLVEIATGEVVKEGLLRAWNGSATDQVSGDRVWWFDFSDVVTPGKYAVVDREKGIRSIDFSIGDGVYREVMKHALRTFFYQRVGFEKKAEFAGSGWADKSSHLGPGQDPQSRPWPGTRSSPGPSMDPEVRDLRGGWYDAGDYNKYTSWAARNIIVLLRAYQESPTAFSDDLGIPESGNGIPDILDEVKWGLDWLVRMQNSDGGLLCVQGLAGGSPPSTARGPSYYGPPTTAATLMGASAFAYAATIYAGRQEPALREFAENLANRARAAWDWAAANPEVRYYNNDNARQPRSGGLASGQQEMNDAERFAAKFEAAVYLYEVTGKAAYRDFVDANYVGVVPNYGPTQWDSHRQEALLYYTRLAGASPAAKVKIIAQFASGMVRNADQFPMIIADKDPYLSPMKDYTWGSNMAKAFQARLYQLYSMYGNNKVLADNSLSAALQYVHYIHGVNPLGIVYLTNMRSAGARHSATTMFHTWFAHGTRWEKASETLPGPPPGYLVGGPNPSFSTDGCCAASAGSGGVRCGSLAALAVCKQNFSPPAGQPPLKSYLQFNDGWPANSWEVTEPSTSYQAAYIRVLAPFVQ